MFSACRYQGKPAVYDKKSRVYYFGFKTMQAAKSRADSLNKGD